jgi:hypothetical protein
MEAQRYPEDFNGILDAPAHDVTHLLTGFVWNEQELLNTLRSSIAPGKLPAIQNAALAACDSDDGLKDGLLSDPRTCRFVPKLLVDTGSDYTWIPGRLLEKIGAAREKKDLPFLMANGQRITRSVGFAIIRQDKYFTLLLTKSYLPKRATSRFSAPELWKD